MLTTEEILAHVRAAKCVGYYNKDNKEKEDKKNNYADGIAVGEPHLLHNSISSFAIGIASCEALEANSKAILASPEAQGQGSEIEPEIEFYDLMKTALIQLFDNGEQSRQRYKCKVRINMTDGTNPEFIANLTKDIRNFKKYIPEEGREQVIEFATEIKKKIKKLHGTDPYLGKFHFNIPNTGSRTIEPMTAVVIWYDNANRGWSGCLMMYDWVHQFDLFSQYLTDKQRAAGVKAQDTFTHPSHQKSRPLTWAQRRAQNK